MGVRHQFMLCWDFLPAQDVFGRDFSAHADELATKLKNRRFSGSKNC